MAKLATCPGCTTQLALPEEATLSDEARCPRCGEEFPLMEVVQFSIPTAELIPARDQSTSSEVAQWAEKTMVREPQKVSPPVEATSDAIETEDNEVGPTVTECPDADLTTTLSDWEARLKRAISDTEPNETAEDSSESDLPDHESTTSQPATKLSDTLKDFSFPHEDLEPDSRDAPLSPAQQSGARDGTEPALTSWSSAEADQFDFDSSEPTVKTTADTTITDFVAPSDTDMEIDTTSTLTPRKKNRSFARTMLSASLGVVGIPLGLYALLWIKGPAADVAHLADHLPGFMLPSSMQTTSTPFEESATALVKEDSDLLPSEDGEAMPALVDDPEVQPATAEEPVYDGPKFAMVESEEFGKLLAAAKQAAPELAIGSLTDNASKKRKGHAYIALCRLAEKCSFMNQPGLTAEDTDRVTEAQKLFESTLSRANVLEELPLIAGPWWDFEARPSPGIVIAGRVERVETTAVGSLARIQLGEYGTTVPVLLGNGLPRPGAHIGIVGTIVNDPATSIPALSETSEPIVVGHFSFSTDDSLSGEPN